MKNTEICPSEYIKSEVLYRKMLRQINLLEHQIFEVKEMTSIFWDIRLKKLDISGWLIRGDDRWWETASNDISERWKEIDEGKEEVEWLIADLCASIEREGEQYREKTEKDKCRG